MGRENARSVRDGARRIPAASLALLVAAVAVMVLRRPEYFIAPGFWAEEGALYFAGAWAGPWGQALINRPAGYLLLWTNVAAVLGAHLVPLRDAPLVTTLMALAAQALPLAVVAFGLAPEWRSAARKTVGMAVVLFASLTGEVWLNTINSQFYLGLAAALLLLEPAELSTARTIAYALLLALAGMSGIAGASLAPLFGARAWGVRTRATVVLAAVATACAVVQVLALWSAGPLSPVRQAGLGLAAAGLVVWMKTLVLPVLGVEAAHRFVRAAVGIVGGDLSHPPAVALGAVLLLSAGALLGGLAAPLSGRVRLALAGSYVVFTAAAVLGGVGDRRMFLTNADNSSRYFYAPGALLLLLLMANAFRAGRAAGRVRAAACGALLVIGLSLGMVRYRASLRWQPWWPRWRDEVAAWERDPRRPLAIWPPPKWRLSLRPRAVASP